MRGTRISHHTGSAQVHRTSPFRSRTESERTGHDRARNVLRSISLRRARAPRRADEEHNEHDGGNKAVGQRRRQW